MHERNQDPSQGLAHGAIQFADEACFLEHQAQPCIFARKHSSAKFFERTIQCPGFLVAFCTQCISWPAFVRVNYQRIWVDSTRFIPTVAASQKLCEGPPLLEESVQEAVQVHEHEIFLCTMHIDDFTGLKQATIGIPRRYLLSGRFQHRLCVTNLWQAFLLNGVQNPLQC